MGGNALAEGLKAFKLEGDYVDRPFAAGVLQAAVGAGLGLTRMYGDASHPCSTFIAEKNPQRRGKRAPEPWITKI